MQERAVRKRDGSPQTSALIDWSMRKCGKELFHRVVDYDHAYMMRDTKQWNGTGIKTIEQPEHMSNNLLN